MQILLVFQTCAADIYSLGCVFYYVFSNGRLPFKNLDGYIERIQDLNFSGFRVGSSHLIPLLTSTNPAERPSASAVRSHHLFFSNQERVSFLCDVQRCIESNQGNKHILDCQREVENYRDKIWKRNDKGWMQNLSTALVDHLKAQRKQRPQYQNSVYELLKLIRECHEELYVCEPSLSNTKKQNTSECILYWDKKFPCLVHYVWLVFQKVKSDAKIGVQKYYMSGNDYTFTQMRKINNEISYDPSCIIGKGNGTQVFKGVFQHREVAVKRIDTNVCGIQNTEKEIEILLMCDKHENVTRYFCKETEENGLIYLAIELCDYNLEDWVRNMRNNQRHPQNEDKISRREILRQIITGLSHLHNNKVVHRDLKPENILIQRINTDTMRVKITDFGISKILPEGRRDATRETSSGSQEWMPPEALETKANQTQCWKMVMQ